MTVQAGIRNSWCLARSTTDQCLSREVSVKACF